MNNLSSFRLTVIGLGALMAGRAAFAQSSIFDEYSGGCPFCSGGASVDGFSDPPVKSKIGSTGEPQAEAVKPAAPAPVVNSSVAATSVATPVTTPSDATAKPPAPAEPAAPFPEIKQARDGFWQVSFQNLASFRYTAPPPDKLPTPGKKRDIPANVQALEGRRVRISGYMLPVQLEGGFVKVFLLLRSPGMCCYGIVPSPNEWVLVKMKDKAVKVPPLMDVPLNFYGTLHVGEIYEDKMFAGIYQLEGEKVSVN